MAKRPTSPRRRCEWLHSVYRTAVRPVTYLLTPRRNAKVPGTPGRGSSPRVRPVPIRINENLVWGCATPWLWRVGRRRKHAIARRANVHAPRATENGCATAPHPKWEAEENDRRG